MNAFQLKLAIVVFLGVLSVALKTLKTFKRNGINNNSSKKSIINHFDRVFMCYNYHVNCKCFIHGRLVKSCLIDSNTS